MGFNYVDADVSGRYGDGELDVSSHATGRALVTAHANRRRASAGVDFALEGSLISGQGSFQ